MLLQVRRAVSGRLQPMFACVLIASIALSACDRAPLLAPTGTVIFLNAAAPSAGPTSTVEITAVLLEQGTISTPSNGNGGTTTTTPAAGTTVHNGTVVSFTTNIGRIEPAEAKTVNGQVKVNFVGDGRSGAAKITAFSGGARTEMTLNVGAAAAERVNVTVGSLGSSGGTTAVNATVEDASGNPLSGVTVQFSTTKGTLNPTSAQTNANGVATSSLTTTGDAVVTATAGSKSGTANLTLGAKANLTITAPGTITASSPATFTITSSTTANIKNVAINWGDGRTDNLGALSGSQTVTHIYEAGGNYTVTATATMADGTTEPSSGTSISVGEFTVTMSTPTQTPAVNSSVTFTATVTPNTTNVREYQWNFGDGTNPVTTPGPTTNHFFSSTGPRRVTVTVIPVTGQSRSTFTDIIVQ